MGEELYDTNVLIEKWRRGTRELSGYTTVFNVIEFPKALLIRGLKVLYPDIDDLNLAIRLAKDLMKAGSPVGAVDVIIAAIAIRRGLTVVTTDSDFERIRRVEPRLRVRLYRQTHT